MHSNRYHEAATMMLEPTAACAWTALTVVWTADFSARPATNHPSAARMKKKSAIKTWGYVSRVSTPDTRKSESNLA